MRRILTYNCRKFSGSAKCFLELLLINIHSSFKGNRTSFLLWKDRRSTFGFANCMCYRWFSVGWWKSFRPIALLRNIVFFFCYCMAAVYVLLKWKPVIHALKLITSKGWAIFYFMLYAFAHVDVASAVVTVCTRTAVCLRYGTVSLMRSSSCW